MEDRVTRLLARSTGEIFGELLARIEALENKASAAGLNSAMREAMAAINRPRYIPGFGRVR